MLTTKEKLKNALVPAAAIPMVLISGCGDDDDAGGNDGGNNETLLVGDWQVESVDGEDNSDYNIAFSFESDGDFTLSNSYEYEGQTYSYSYDGSWEFIDGSNQNSVAISYVDDDQFSYELTMDIITLTEDQLVGDFVDTDEPDETYRVVFSRQ